MIEDGNKWGNPKKFIEKYGVLEKITTIKEEEGLTTKAKRRTTRIGPCTARKTISNS